METYTPDINSAKRSEDQEVTLKDIITKVTEFTIELWNKKWWIIFLSMLPAIYFGYRAIKYKPLFTAELTYMLNDASATAGALSGILGSIGLGKGGKVNLDRIVALSKSKFIINKILMTEVALDTFGGKKDLLANHIIRLYNLEDEWTEMTQKNWKGFRFNSTNVDNFNLQELQALKMLYGKMMGDKKTGHALFSNSFNEDTGILSIRSTSYAEDLSIQIANLAFQYLKDFYVESVVTGTENTFTFAKTKTDSIFAMLKAKEFELAKFNDSHRNLVDPGLITQRKLLETEILKLKSMYAEATKNRELADFSFSTSIPEIKIIDQPLPPLDIKMKTPLIEAIKGGIIGFLLSAFIFLGRKVILDALKY